MMDATDKRVFPGNIEMSCDVCNYIYPLFSTTCPKCGSDMSPLEFKEYLSFKKMVEEDEKDGSMDSLRGFLGGRGYALDINNDPPQFLVLENELIGEYFIDFKFWGDQLINLQIKLGKNQEEISLSNYIDSRNLF